MKQIEITFKSNLEKGKDYIDLDLCLKGTGKWIGNTYFSDPYDETDSDEYWPMRDFIDIIKEDVSRMNLDATVETANSTRIYGSYCTTKQFELMNGGFWM